MSMCAYVRTYVGELPNACIQHMCVGGACAVCVLRALSKPLINPSSNPTSAASLLRHASFVPLFWWLV